MKIRSKKYSISTHLRCFSMLAAHRSMAVGLAILRPIAWENVCLAPCERKITNIRNRKQMWIVWGKNKGALYIRKGKDYSLKKLKSEQLRHWTKYIHTRTKRDLLPTNFSATNSLVRLKRRIWEMSALLT